MSVPTSRQAFAFLAPLRGRASVFVAPTRRRNSRVARFLLGCLAASRRDTVVFDTSSFYGTNILSLTESLPKDFLQKTTIISPLDGQDIEDSIADVLAMKTEAIIIDDLNALHYLLSPDRQKSGIHRLFTLFRLFSYEARINNQSVFATVYKPEGDYPTERVTKRSLSAAADLQISTDDSIEGITFRCKEVKGWPDNRFTAPLYF